MRNIIGNVSILLIFIGAFIWGWFLLHNVYGFGQLFGIIVLSIGGCGFVLN